MENKPCSLSKISFRFILNNISEGKQAMKLIQQIRILTTLYLLTWSKIYEQAMLIKIIMLHKRLLRKNPNLANLLKTCYNVEIGIHHKISKSSRYDGRTSCGYGFSRHREEDGMLIDVYSNLFDIFGYDKNCKIKLTYRDPIGCFEELKHKKEIKIYSSRVKRRVNKILSEMRIVENPMNMFLEWYYDE